MSEQDAASGPVKPRLFISYSRTDSAMADRIEAGMAERGFAILRDVEDIAYGELWWARLVTMIGEADTVLFLLTPRAAASPVCGKEVAEAHRRGKRIMPLLIEATDWNSLPTALAAINSLSLVGLDDGVWPAKLDQLRDALLTDLPWVRQHSRLGAAAETWAEGGRSSADLLAGTELRRALDWLAHVPPKAAEPTPLQREYIAASEAARHRRRVTLLASIAAATILILAAAAIALLYRLDARLGAARVALQNNDLAAAQQAMIDYSSDPIGRLFPPTRTARQLASEILDRGTISPILHPGLAGDGRFEAMEVADNQLFLLRQTADGPRLIRCDLAVTACASRRLAPVWKGAGFVTDGTRIALTPPPPTPGFTSTVPVPTEPEAIATSGTPALLGPGSARGLAAPAGPHQASFPISENPPPPAKLVRSALQCDDTGTICLSSSQPPETSRAQIDAFAWGPGEGNVVQWTGIGTLVPAGIAQSLPFAVSRDGARAAASEGHMLRIWDGRLLTAGLTQEPMTVALPVEPKALRFGSGGSILFVLSEAGIIRLDLDIRGAPAAGDAGPPPGSKIAPVAGGLAWEADGHFIVRREGDKVVRRRVSDALFKLLDEAGRWGAVSVSDDGPFAFARANMSCPTDADGPVGADLVLAPSASSPPSLLLVCAQSVSQTGEGLMIAGGGPGRFLIGGTGMGELIEWTPGGQSLRLHHIGDVRSGGAPSVAVTTLPVTPPGADGLARVDLTNATRAGPGMVGAYFAARANRLGLLDTTDLLTYDLDTARLTKLPSAMTTTAGSFDISRRGWLSSDGRIAILATPTNAGTTLFELFDAAEGRRLSLPPGTNALTPRDGGRFRIAGPGGWRCWSVPEAGGDQVALLESILRAPRGKERPAVPC